MKIAICDDEMEFANIMQKELHKLEKQLNEKIETVLFKNGGGFSNFRYLRISHAWIDDVFDFF